MPLCSRLSVCLVYAPYGLSNEGNEGHGRARDLLIVNFGAHPASGAHWTVAQFAGRVRKFTERFAVTSPMSFPLIWLGQVAPTVRDDRFVVDPADWRTFNRMLLFERAARNATQDLVARGLVRYVDIFAIGMAASRWSNDGAHLVGSEPALNGIIDLLLLQICEKVQ